MTKVNQENKNKFPFSTFLVGTVNYVKETIMNHPFIFIQLKGREGRGQFGGPQGKYKIEGIDNTRTNR